MMRKLFVLLSLVLALGLTSCKCSAERAAVVQVEKSHDMIAKKLLDYVDRDASLNAAAKDDWKKLVESDRRNIESLKKALGD
jgi:hypothetical protein